MPVLGSSVTFNSHNTAVSGPSEIRTLSILIPVYNEVRTIASVVAQVSAVFVHELGKEVIVIDDGSTDGTCEILTALATDSQVKLVRQPTNKGKGAAIREGLKHVTGDLVIIQDADLEVSPDEYPKLIAPFIEDPTIQVVFGSRFLAKRPHKRSLALFANQTLTALTNLLYRAQITDMETCYKLCRAEVLKKLNLECDRFDIEPEITSKLLRLGYRIHEVPVIYNPRTRADGKKINWRDGARAVVTLLKYRFKS